MVVRNDDVMHHLERKSVFMEIFFYCAYAQSGIYHQPVSFRKKTIAIAAATATKRYEFQHQCLYFYTKVSKRYEYAKVFG